MARLEAVLDASPLPIAVLDAAGEIQRWNQAAETVSGWAAEDVVGKPWRLVPGPGEKRAEGLQRRALAGERLDHLESDCADTTASHVASSSPAHPSAPPTRSKPWSRSSPMSPSITRTRSASWPSATR